MAFEHIRKYLEKKSDELDRLQYKRDYGKDEVDEFGEGYIQGLRQGREEGEARGYEIAKDNMTDYLVSMDQLEIANKIKDI